MFRDDSSSLQQPCICGHGKGQQCTERNLKNHQHFSAFAYLQDVNDVDDDYYQESSRGCYNPSRHWALIGEIKEINMSLRPRVLLTTRFGETFPVHFYLENSTSPSCFEWDSLKPDNTMCIFYPKRHQFMDLTTGIRQENPDTVMVFPTSQEILEQECCFLADHNTVPTCFGCGQQAEQQLKRCSTCKLAYYCSRDCQLGHWKTSHKKLCRHYQMLSNLVKMDFSKFEGFVNWNFAVEQMPSIEEQEERNRQALHDWMREKGLEPLSKSRRLLELLEHFQDTVLQSDDTSGSMLEHQSGALRTLLHLEHELSSPMSDNTLFRGLSSLARRFSENGSREHRSFVVDLKSNNPIEDTGNDVLFTTLFLSLPQWQLQKEIRGISWAFETHHLLQHESIFPSSLWEVTREIDSLVAKNRHACAFYHDDMSIVSDVALHMAENRPDELVVRVLRAAGGVTYTDFVPTLANADTPSNMITLWIREDLASQGIKFNAPRPGASLVAQLTDFTELTFIERLQSLRFGETETGHDEAET